MMRMNRVLVLVAMLTGGLLMVGCSSGSRVGAFNVQVSVAKSIADDKGRIPSLEVDLIGVKDVRKSEFSSYSMSKYFSGTDQFRRDTRHKTMVFTTNNKDAHQMLMKKDALWKDWKGSSWLFVLVNLPGVGKDEMGGADPRRMILPLDKSRWAGNTIRLEVQGSGIALLTEMKPEQN